MMAAVVVAVPLAERPDRPQVAAAPSVAPAKLDALKQEALADVESRAQFSQQMVDQIFSYGELGFQEVETNRYLIDVLKKNGFAVEEGHRGHSDRRSWRRGDRGSRSSRSAPTSTAFRRRRRSRASPIATRSIEGAPGHGEGHNSGQAVNITAAIAVKKIMQREGLSGHDPDLAGHGRGARRHQGATSSAPASSRTSTSRCSRTSATTSACRGASATAPGWSRCCTPSTARPRTRRAARGAAAARSTPCELMDIGWNFRREHLRLSQRSHYVIVDGGDQPNVVPRTASVWYYFREIDYPHIKEMWETGDTIAKGGRDDDRRAAAADHGPRQRLAAALEQGRGRDDVGEHPEGRAARVERRGSAAREGLADRAEESARRRAGHAARAMVSRVR